MNLQTVNQTLFALKAIFRHLVPCSLRRTIDYDDGRMMDQSELRSQSFDQTSDVDDESQS